MDRAGLNARPTRISAHRSCCNGRHAVLPTTLNTAESDGGAETQITFTRIIVHADGHKEIEGVTPKALPAPKPVDETLMQPGDESNN